MSNTHGAFVWYELATIDTAAAKNFYGKVVGWTDADMEGPPGMTYKVLSAGGVGIGGMVALTPDARAAGARPGWIGYIGVDDVDASARKVTELGGSIHRGPDDIPTIGRFALAADPGGGLFTLFKPMGGPEPMPVPRGTPGHAGWRELMAADGAAAFDFYAELFGWTKDMAVDMGAMGVYQTFAKDGVQTGGMMTKPPGTPGGPAWGYYFNVESATAGLERIKAAGGQVTNGPMEVPNGDWIVQGVDPQGAFFAIVGPRG